MCNTCGCGYYPTYLSGQYCDGCGIWFSGVHSCTALKDITNQYNTVISVGYLPVLERIADALEKLVEQGRAAQPVTSPCGEEIEKRTPCTCELCISPRNETGWDRFGEYKPDQG